jgi:hypothetical protein
VVVSEVVVVFLDFLVDDVCLAFFALCVLAVVDFVVVFACVVLEAAGADAGADISSAAYAAEAESRAEMATAASNLFIGFLRLVCWAKLKRNLFRLHVFNLGLFYMLDIISISPLH